KQVIYAHTLNPIAGTEIIPVPTLKIKHTRQQKLVSSWISSPNKVGRIANELKLKIEKYGIFVLDKSRSSDKQVKSFRYNTKAIKVIREYLINKK
ncbi:MAG: hypothetical protein J6562_07040, partial [Candidatus Schmidhempelia sp.]|nr:hypothetical protein [Candidatus Schmidhempelia sp.]